MMMTKMTCGASCRSKMGGGFSAHELRWHFCERAIADETGVAARRAGILVK
jgi:hypothetical protein